MSEAELSRLRSYIAAAADIVLVGHVNPDGDAIGSTLSWANYLAAEGKNVRVIVPDKYPDFLNWLPNTDKILRHDKHQEEAESILADADLIFCLDFNTLSRSGNLANCLGAVKATKILIDHHLNPDVPCELTISDPRMCSTCEMVFRLVWQLGAFEKLSNHFAVPCYCGMMTDTGGFTFNSSRPVQDSSRRFRAQIVFFRRVRLQNLRQGRFSCGAGALPSIARRARATRC